MPLTKAKLLHYMEDLESDRVERTVSTTDTGKFCKAICAFANDLAGHGKPGYLFLGVTDEGKPSGLVASDELLLKLGAIRSDGNVQPLPVLALSTHSFQDGDVVIVEVQPSIFPPVRYKGKVWIRVGPRKAEASEQEEHILSERRTAKMLTFDAQPCQGAGLNELSIDLFAAYRREAVDPDIIAANHRSEELQLSSLRLYDLKHECPTHAGILLFGKNPLYWLLGAYVQFLRYDGVDIAEDPADEKQIDGDLLSVLRRLDELVAVHNKQRSVPDSSLREKTNLDYPPFAIREFLMNAIMHRTYESTAPIRFYWYSDRIEIQNPGGLYGEAAANFPNQNAYRNPVVAEAMKNLGYVNRFGHGVLRAQRLLEENGNPPAEISFPDNKYAQVVIRTS